MAKDPAFLRQKFLRRIEKDWRMNEHPPEEISCVYVIAGYAQVPAKASDIFYVGSTVNMFLRYKSHKAPRKIQELGYFNILYYLPMENGFYDYERKLIFKLQPTFNRQHKNG